MKNISEHISYGEATKSNTALRYGIDNVPNDEELTSMHLVAENVFEPLREFAGHPIRINSFFRSAALNKKVGGSKTSSHTKGQAMDIDSLGNLTNLEMAKFIIERLSFDQVIIEYPNIQGEPKWVHLSYVSEDKNRNQVLVCKRVGGRVVYSVWKNENLL